MSESYACVGRGRWPRNTRAVLRRAGLEAVEPVCANVPGEGPRRWLAFRSYGDPFDRSTAQAAREALQAAGILPSE